jgi:hypothetical protein
MNGFKAYRYYLALKLHFTKEKFNVFENRGNVKVSLDTYLARNDSYLFEKLSRKYNTDKAYIQYIVSNFAYGNINMIYDEGTAEQYYIKWNKVKESITRTFTDNLNTIVYEAEKQGIDISDVNNCTNNDIPFIIKLYLGKLIQPQTISIINDFTNVIDMWQLEPTVNLILEDDLIRMKKLKGFFSYDKEKLKQIYISHSVGV